MLPAVLGEGFDAVEDFMALAAPIFVSRHIPSKCDAGLRAHSRALTLVGRRYGPKLAI